MVNTCAAYKCKSRYKKNSDISFYRFPKDSDLCKAWIYATRRLNFTPTYYTRLCSKHFNEDEFQQEHGKKCLKKGVIPSIFDDFPKHLQKPRRKVRSTRLQTVSTQNTTTPDTSLCNEIQKLEEFINIPTASALFNDCPTTITSPQISLSNDAQVLEEFIQFPAPPTVLNEEVCIDVDKPEKSDQAAVIPSIHSFLNNHDPDEIVLWVFDSEPQQESTQEAPVPPVDPVPSPVTVSSQNPIKAVKRPPLHFSDIDLEYLSEANTCKLKKVYSLAVDAITRQRGRINTLILQKKKAVRQIAYLTKMVDGLNQQLSNKNNEV